MGGKSLIAAPQGKTKGQAVFMRFMSRLDERYWRRQLIRSDTPTIPCARPAVLQGDEIFDIGIREDAFHASTLVRAMISSVVIRTVAAPLSFLNRWPELV